MTMTVGNQQFIKLLLLETKYFIRCMKYIHSSAHQFIITFGQNRFVCILRDLFEHFEVIEARIDD